MSPTPAPPPHPPAPQGFPRLARRTAHVAAWLGIVYAVLFFLHHRFPYYGEGGRVVTAEKLRHVSTQALFPPEAPRRVVIFGNSKVLSGFVPDTFDALSGGRSFLTTLACPMQKSSSPSSSRWCARAAFRPTF